MILNWEIGSRMQTLSSRVRPSCHWTRKMVVNRSTEITLGHSGSNRPSRSIKADPARLEAHEVEVKGFILGRKMSKDVESLWPAYDHHGNVSGKPNTINGIEMGRSNHTCASDATSRGFCFRSVKVGDLDSRWFGYSIVIPKLPCSQTWPENPH